MTVAAYLLQPIFAGATGGFPLWTNRYNGPGNSNDYVAALRVNAESDVVMTGYGRGSTGSDEFLTINYQASGLPVWTNRYGGSAPGNDRAIAMALDSVGDVYVTGISAGNGTGDDFATIKYSSAGVPLWTNRFSSLGNGSDTPRAIATDDHSVYVAGQTPQSDFLVIAYSVSGAPLWTNHGPGVPLPGPFGPFPSVAAMAVADDRVYVTGNSITNGISFDVMSVAYSSATGERLWINRFSNPGDFDDLACAILVNETVCVAAISVRDPSFELDNVTIAYTTNGVPLWTNRFPLGASLGRLIVSPSCLAADQAGNIYRVGYTSVGGPLRFAAVAYSNSGLPLWTNTQILRGYATGVMVDSDTNIFVHGETTLNFSPASAVVAHTRNGTAIWTNYFQGGLSPSGFGMDAEGNVYVAGVEQAVPGNSDFFLVKYSAIAPHAIPLTIEPAPIGLILRWPNPAFDLQSAPTLTSGFTNIPAATSPYTNLFSEPQQYFRLKAK